LKFDVLIRSPIKKNIFRCIFSKEKKISDNKSFEIEMFWFSDELFRFAIDIKFGGDDHAGPELELNILGLTFAMKIYDHRHWNYENNSWEE
jgi:hypothetical protein